MEDEGLQAVDVKLDLEDLERYGQKEIEEFNFRKTEKTKV